MSEKDDEFDNDEDETQSEQDKAEIMALREILKAVKQNEAHKWEQVIALLGELHIICIGNLNRIKP